MTITKSDRLLLAMVEMHCSQDDQILLDDSEVHELSIMHLVDRGILVATDDYGYIVHPNFPQCSRFNRRKGAGREQRERISRNSSPNAL